MTCRVDNVVQVSVVCEDGHYDQEEAAVEVVNRIVREALEARSDELPTGTRAMVV